MKITTIPNVYRNVNRWGEILTILSKYGLAGWVSRFDVPLVKGFLKNREGEKLAHLSRETRIRMAIEELGPTFIKLGQILSTRPDQVGMPLAHELQKLQTQVGCDDAKVVRTTIEAELEQPLETLFADFDSTPLASARTLRISLLTRASSPARSRAPFSMCRAWVVMPVVVAQETKAWCSPRLRRRRVDTRSSSRSSSSMLSPKGRHSSRRLQFEQAVLMTEREIVLVAELGGIRNPCKLDPSQP